MSFRDRFFTPRVARAMTSVSAILSTGGGAAIGMLVGGPPGAVIGALLGWATRVGLAVPRTPQQAAIDPFTLGEPWNRLMNDALAAQRQFGDAVRRTPAGPLRDRLGEIGSRIDEGIAESWEVAQAGRALSGARKRINLIQIRREYDDLQARLAASPDSSTLQATQRALQSQIDTATRMDSTIAETEARLRLLGARLDEAVTRTIELSVSRADAEALSGVGSDVEDIVNEMEALRSALGETREASGGSLAPSPVSAPAPTPVQQPADPPPTPRTDPGPR